MSRRAFRLALFSTALLVLAAGLGLLAGPRSLSLAALAEAVRGHGDDEAWLILAGLRAPRVLLGGLVGAALAVAGGIIQAATRNPLGDPGLLGINAGAGLAVVVGTGLLGLAGAGWILVLAALGATLAALAVPLLAGLARSSDAPVRLTLAGVAVGALCYGLTQAAALADPERFDLVRNWRVGALSGDAAALLPAVAPALLAGFLVSALLAPALNVAALGEERAATLGLPLGATRALALLAVILLAGGATAAAGPIGFVGLAAPHAVRLLVGADARAALVHAGLIGAALVIAADALGRVAVAPAEVPVGIVTTLVGAPVLLLLVRTRARRPA
ncbi:iron ABC transporter permease [Ancylobacter sonchi]|uniref:FecCD family ABC transporter permease n=1 Tax=Ancylobacter sonchi TaxID=1937790 RepID=UPI001BD6A7F4|nr:iron ABC transporter permease [Ancylobacter sonchi]MBS7535356.1 iron ABC transporter permease [Ancylobacter sonchi]